MAYRVVFRPQARRDLKKLQGRPLGLRQRVQETFRALEANPRMPGSKPLAGEHDLWRVRVGDWRIVYAIDDASQVVRITLVRHRGDVYRAL